MARLRAIAELLGVPFRGTDEAEISRVSSIEEAASDCVVFSTDATTLAGALASGAGGILASRKAVCAGAEAEILLEAGSGGEGGSDSRVLIVGDARYAFAVVARMLRQEEQELLPSERGGLIAGSAVVGRGARIGKRTRVGEFAVIEDGAEIGEDCSIGARVVIHSTTRLGDRVAVQAGAVLGSQGFGYVRSPVSGEYLIFPQQGRLIVEDDVEIGALTAIDRGALGETRIGRGTKIDNLVQIAHNVQIGPHCILAGQAAMAGSVTLGAGVALGGQAAVRDHVKMGDGSMAAGCSGVAEDVEPKTIVSGTPAFPHRQSLREQGALRRLPDLVTQVRKLQEELEEVKKRVGNSV